MPIFKKDGTVFRLTEPNPIMMTQDTWDDNEPVVLHNFGLPKTNETIPVVKPEETDQVFEVSFEDVVEEPVIVPEPKKPQSQYRSLDRTYLYCLPVEIKTITDRLYDEVRSTMKYNDPFRFQAAIMLNGDLNFQFWSTISGITKSSIIFHVEYKRWWKVAEINTVSDGYIANCVISDFQPSFDGI